MEVTIEEHRADSNKEDVTPLKINSHKVAILDLCIPLFDTTQSITCNWM